MVSIRHSLIYSIKRNKGNKKKREIKEGNRSMCVRREYIWGMVGCLAIADIFIRVMVWMLSNEAWGVLRCISALVNFAAISVLALVAYVVLKQADSASFSKKKEEKELERRLKQLEKELSKVKK